MIDVAIFGITVLSLLVAIASLAIGSNENKAFRYGISSVFLLISCMFGSIGVFSFIDSRIPETTSEEPRVSNTETTAIDSSISRFEVKSTVPKNPTGLTVSAGDIMYFEYLDGQWTGSKTEPGVTIGCGFTFDDPVKDHVWALPPEQRGSALIGYVGNTPFWIGCESTGIIAPTSGELYLGMSDCQDCFGDNSGELFVKLNVSSD